jgi:transaldolase
MELFLDTANLDEIREASHWGILDGVTTNPSHVAKESMPFRELLAEICALVKGPISAEVVSLTAEEMIEEARSLVKIGDNIVIKVPCIPEGIRAVTWMTQEGINTNVTLVFSAVQAMLAAKAGATYVSPFVGRLDDVSQSGMDLINDIMTIYRNYGYQSEVIVASVRHPMHVVEAALVGADIATIPFKVIAQLAKHPLTDIGMEKFLSDWEKRAQ